MYDQTCTRPDITFTSFAAGMLERIQSNQIWSLDSSQKSDTISLGTKNLVLTYWYGDYLEIVGHSDSDFMYCVNSMISTYYVFMLASGAMSWKRVKQFIAISYTMKAKFIACKEATSQTIWLLNSIEDLECGFYI